MRKVMSIFLFGCLTMLGILLSASQGTSQAQIVQSPTKACLATNLKAQILGHHYIYTPPSTIVPADIFWRFTFDCTDATQSRCAVCVTYDLYIEKYDDNGAPYWSFEHGSPASETPFQECNSIGISYDVTSTTTMVKGYRYKWVLLLAPYDPTVADCERQANWVEVGSSIVAP